MSGDTLINLSASIDACPGKERHGCCPQSQCSHAELSRIETPDDPVDDRIESAGRSVAATCPMLNSTQLRACFSSLFDITADCRLYGRFSAAYYSERAAGDRG